MLLLSPWLLGCVPVVGRLEASVLPLPEQGFYNPWYWTAIGLLVLGLALRTRVAFAAPRLSGLCSIRNSIVIATLQTLGSWTFVGIWAYMLFSGFHDFGPAGAALLIVISFILGLAPGFLGLFPLLLYGIYHDLFLLQAAALPALAGFFIETLYLSAKLSQFTRLQKLSD